jgi:hypothetical protein
MQPNKAHIIKGDFLGLNIYQLGFCGDGLEVKIKQGKGDDFLYSKFGSGFFYFLLIFSLFGEYSKYI